LISKKHFRARYYVLNRAKKSGFLRDIVEPSPLNVRFERPRGAEKKDGIWQQHSRLNLLAKLLLVPANSFISARTVLSSCYREIVQILVVDQSERVSKLADQLAGMHLHVQLRFERQML
jgi:hypothetical protein